MSVSVAHEHVYQLAEGPFKTARDWQALQKRPSDTPTSSANKAAHVPFDGEAHERVVALDARAVRFEQAVKLAPGGPQHTAHMQCTASSTISAEQRIQRAERGGCPSDWALRLTQAPPAPSAHEGIA